MHPRAQETTGSKIFDIWDFSLLLLAKPNCSKFIGLVIDDEHWIEVPEGLPYLGCPSG
jgi:hypothetical protein